MSLVLTPSSSTHKEIAILANSTFSSALMTNTSSVSRPISPLESRDSTILHSSCALVAKTSRQFSIVRHSDSISARDAALITTELRFSRATKWSVWIRSTHYHFVRLTNNATTAIALDVKNIYVLAAPRRAALTQAVITRSILLRNYTRKSEKLTKH